MCGRYSIRASVKEVADHFGLPVGELPALTPRYNVAPTQSVPVVLLDPGRGVRQLRLLHWGLIPSWADDPAIGNRMINARAETAADKPAFRQALKRRRCLVVADGFYEWQKQGKAKQPFHIRMKDDRPFGFAGLWEHWSSPDGSELDSCTILTTAANDLVRSIHERMPVIIPPEHYQRWLDPQSSQYLDLLQPYPPDAMLAHPVSARVNTPTNDTPDCVAPLVQES